MCDDVVRLMGKGLSKEATCAELGISKSMMYRYIEEHEEFRDAIKKAELACRRWWEEKGRLAVQGQIEGFNATAYVWMTKNILNWKDKQEITGEGGGPIKAETKVLNFVGVDTEHQDPK